MLNEIRLRPKNFVLIFAQPYVLNTYVQDCLTFSHYTIFVQRTKQPNSQKLANSKMDESRQRRRRLLLLLLAMMKLKQAKKKVRFKDLLNEEGRKRRSRQIPRVALQDPTESSWQTLYESGDDAALITVTGFDHNAFQELLKIYKPYYDGYSPWTGNGDGRTYCEINPSKGKGRGAPRIISVEQSLGLTLAWFRFRGAEWILQGWFGFTGTHCNVWLRFGRRMLLKAMLNHPDARVKFPTDEEIRVLRVIVQNKHPSLNEVYCHIDGLKLYLESNDSLEIQGMYYNGWLHDHFVTNLFVFSSCGRIIACVAFERPWLGA